MFHNHQILGIDQINHFQVKVISEACEFSVETSCAAIKIGGVLGYEILLEEHARLHNERGDRLNLLFMVIWVCVNLPFVA